MSYSQIVTEDVRLSILEMLSQDADYSHNEHIIGRGLQMLGHALSSDRVRTELQWLAEQGLLSLESVGELIVAKLNQRGHDAARGLAQVPGVARPRPGR